MLYEAIGELGLAGTNPQVLAAGTAYSDVIDLGAARSTIGAGGDIWLTLRTSTPQVFDGGDETFIFSFMVDSAEAMTTDPRAVIVIADHDGSAIVTGDAESDCLKTAGGIIFCGTLPYGVTERYGRWCYISVGAALEITIDAFVSPSRPATDPSRRIHVSNVTAP